MSERQKYGQNLFQKKGVSFLGFPLSFFIFSVTFWGGIVFGFPCQTFLPFAHMLTIESTCINRLTVLACKFTCDISGPAPIPSSRWFPLPLPLKKNEKEYLSYFNEINSIQVSKKIEVDLKNLIAVYLNASKMVQNNVPLNEIEKYFLENNIKKLEEKYLKNNPPFWYFPSAILLVKYAEKIKDINSEEKYKNIFFHLYPNSSFLKLDKKS